MLSRYAIRHPLLVMAVALLAALAVAPGVLKLNIRTDGHALVPAEAKAIQIDAEIRRTFSLEDPVIVLIRTDDPHGIFNAHTIKLVQTLTTAIEGMDGVEPWNVLSLATEHSDRVKPGTLIFRRFLDPLPGTRKELDLLRDDLRVIELYNGTLVSLDESATAIFVGVPGSIDRVEFHRAVGNLIEAQGDIPEEVHIIGPPVAESLLGTHILEDLGVPAVLLKQRRSTSPSSERGIPRSLYQWRVWIGAHVGLVPLALLVMALVFLAGFRSAASVALPLTEVGACLLLVFGLMGYLGVPVYLTIAVLPVILTAIGVADEIHIFSRYREHLSTHPEENHIDLLIKTMGEMQGPVFKTSVTTAAGFLSFSLSPIAPVQAFGLFTAIGVLFCMIWSLTVIPAMLARLNPKKIRPGPSRVEPLPTTVPASIFFRLGRAVIRGRWLVVAGALGIAVLTPSGLRRVIVQDSWIDGFAPDSEFHQATRFFNEQFLGTHILLICVDARRGPPLTGLLGEKFVRHRELYFPANLVENPASLVGWTIDMKRTKPVPWANAESARYDLQHVWRSPITAARRDKDRIVVQTVQRRGSPRMSLRLQSGEQAHYRITPRPLNKPEMGHRIDQLEMFIEGRRDEAVGGVIGTASYLKTINFMVQARKPEERRIPDTPEENEWSWNRFRSVRGIERFHQVMTDDLDRSIIQVYLKDANFVATARLIEAVRRYEESELRPHGLKLSFAGDVAVSQTLIGAIVETQVRSLLISLIVIFTATALLGRSLLWGLYCVLPCALAVLMNFAVMGWVSMPLGVAASMFSGMTLGIGVDYAIHLMERFRRSRLAGLEVEPAVVEAVGATGPAILIDALAVGLGFGILMLSQVPANARLGGLVVLSVVGCLAVTLLLLPGLIRLRPPCVKMRAL